MLEKSCLFTDFFLPESPTDMDLQLLSTLTSKEAKEYTNIVCCKYLRFLKTSLCSVTGVNRVAAVGVAVPGIDKILWGEKTRRWAIAGESKPSYIRH